MAPRVLTLLASERVAPTVATLLTSVLAELRHIDESIRAAEKQLKVFAKGVANVDRIETIPGIGLLTATALIANVGEPSRFRSGRRMSSFVGLVPREHSSGQKRRLGAITKRGDPYLRTLLTHGARSVLLAAARRRAKGLALDRLQSWGLALSERRGHNRATIAVASKMTRLAWAIWSRQDVYRPEAHKPALPAATVPQPAINS